MKITHLVSSAAIVASLVFATPAFAQHRGGGRSAGSSHSSGQAAPRGSAPRASGPSYQRVAPSAARRGPVVVGRAAPRAGGYARVAPRYIGGGYYSPYRFYSPWYSFRPRYSLGFGLSVGYPVVYPYWAYPYYDPYDDGYGYDYPYAYTPPYPAYQGGQYQGGQYPGNAYPGPTSAPYGSPAPGAVTAQNGGVNTGGLSFDITPSNAEVFVDGSDYGPVSDFSANAAPLSLAPGRHHVEIRAQGYETMTFDTDVVAGQVIPYQGAMRR